MGCPRADTHIGVRVQQDTAEPGTTTTTMILYITKSKLFTEDPALRFSRNYAVDEAVWRDMWHRYTAKDYTNDDLAEFFHIRTGKTITPDAVRRWILRAKVHAKAGPAIKKGAQAVRSDFFGDLEEYVVYEVTRHLRYGEAAESRNII